MLETPKISHYFNTPNTESYYKRSLQAKVVRGQEATTNRRQKTMDP